MIKVLKILYTKRRKLLKLPFADKYMLLKASVLLIVLRVLLSFVRTPRLVSWLDRMQPEPIVNYEDRLLKAHRILWAIEVAGNCLFQSPACLPKALATRILLSRKRIPTDLYIGVIMRKEKISGHAWVKLKDQVIMGDSPNLNLYHIVPIPEKFQQRISPKVNPEKSSA